MRRILTIGACLLHIAYAQQEVPDKSKRAPTESLGKIAGSPRYTVLNIGNFTTWSRSDGQSNHSPQGVDGWRFPRNTGNVVYQDAIVWGAKAYRDAAFTQPAPRQVIRVGGGTYGIGTRAGWVTGVGATATPKDPNDANVRIYRIRRDYQQMSWDDLRRDAADVNEIRATEVSVEQVQAVIDQYAKDWNEWPVHLGAPYIERDGIPGFQGPPQFASWFTVDSLVQGRYDEPGIAGPDDELPADQVVWTVYNDLHVGQTMGFAYSEPLGLEVQKTVWGYKHSSALGNIYFTRHKLINKGGVDVDTIAGNQFGAFYLDSMYVCQWVDPDLGSFSDDLAGCDTTLALGFVYNGNPEDATFRAYSLPPPSVGYTLLQGPMIASVGDTAIFDLRKRPNFRNEKMKSFASWGAGDPYSDPCNGSNAGYTCNTGQWWKVVRGFAPLGLITTPDINYVHPVGANPFYMYPGDPVSQSGWIDGQGTSYSFPPGDRRMLMTTGPFTLAPGDTQEVVVAGVAGLGSDRLSSIGVMKSVAQLARVMHKRLFAVPRPPARPNVRAVELNRQIILEWGSDFQRTKRTEGEIIADEYVFEGYHVYQIPSSTQSLNDAVKIATFDLKNGVTIIVEDRFDPTVGRYVPVILQKGEDNGVQRSISITRDAFVPAFTTDERLRNGQEYYFAVTAYNYSQAGSPKALESDPVLVRAKPKVPFGVEFSAKYGDTVAVNRLSGQGEVIVSVSIVDPTVTTGDRYEIRFRQTSSGLVWDVINATQGTTPAPGLSYTGAEGPFPIVDGILARVISPDPDFRDFLVVANANGPLSTPSYGAFQFNSSGFPSAMNPNVVAGDGRDRPAPNVGGARWGIHAGGVGFEFRYNNFVNRVTENGRLLSQIAGNDWEIRFTSAGGYAFIPNLFSTSDSLGGTLISVPFELWRIGANTPNDPSDDVRVFPYINDVRGNSVFDLSGVDHSISGNDNDPETDWIHWILPSNESPGQAGYNAMLSQTQSNPASYRYLGGGRTEIMKRMVLVNYNGGSVSDPSYPNNVNQRVPETGQVFRIVTTKPSSPADVFTYTAPSVRSGREVQKASARRVGVFPNPYYAGWEQETTRWRKFVTFNNLPEKVVIRIYTLAGHLVRTLRKADQSQFLEWDLTNESYWQVASGIYICYVEMPEIGETKILKLAIIQPQLFPE